MRYIFCLLAIIIFTPVQGAVCFNRDFAPQNGIVANIEKPFRSEMCLNGYWKFQPLNTPQALDAKQPLPMPTAGSWDKTPLKLPSPWNVNSFSSGNGGDYRCYPSYPESWEKIKAGWLKKSFTVPAEWKNNRIILHFEAVAGDYVVFVNGKQVGHNFDIFMPYEIDITNAVRYGANNELLVGVRKPELMNISGRLGSITYPSGSFWGLHIAGIWQDVYLLSIPKTGIDK